MIRIPDLRNCDGTFKLRRGQHRGDRRLRQAGQSLTLLWALQDLKNYLKHDPTEKAIKRRGSYDLDRRTAERAHEMLKQLRIKRQQQYGDDYVETRITSVASLRKRLRG